MITLRDARILALTKLRSRRIRTTITVIISGLLFAFLVGALFVAQGAINSIRSFDEVGLNDRYIVQANPDPLENNSLISNTAIQNQATEIYNQMVSQKEAEAQQLGIPYSSESDPPPVDIINLSPSSSYSYLDPSTNAAQQALADYENTHPVPGLAALKQVAAAYHATAFYTATPVSPSGTLTVMTGDQENFIDEVNPNLQNPSINIFTDNPVYIADWGLTKPFMLKNAADTAKLDQIPIIVPYDTAEQLLGLKALSKGASPSQNLDRIKSLYQKAAGITVTACYRNSVSESQIDQAVTTSTEIKQNEDNSAYQPPDLIYGLPAASSCGPAIITSDSRTSAEIDLQNSENNFNARFGSVVTPSQQKLVFRVVGLSANPPNGKSNSSVTGLLQNLAGSSLEGVIAIPRNLLAELPNASQIENILNPTPIAANLETTNSYYAEFATAAQARAFINQKSCLQQSNGTCSTKAKPFQLTAFGNNSIALQDLQRKFSRFFKYAALIAIALAIVILSGTVGRMIADGRRETAVFRAIGAKRFDIALIYTIYTFILSVYIAIFAVLIGMLGAYIFDHHFWTAATVQAQLLFGSFDSSRQFHFFGFDPFGVGVIILAAIATGLISMLLPLERNIRRSPIKDMRDE